MLTTQPTNEMIQEWKRIYEAYHERLKPNRRAGTEVNEYFCDKYSPEAYDDNTFYAIVERNIMDNEPHREKLPNWKLPKIMTYKIKSGTIFVGIDLITGFFHVEGEDIGTVAEIYDDLFVFRGLDEKDIKNYFLVAQYIQCLNYFENK